MPTSSAPPSSVPHQIPPGFRVSDSSSARVMRAIRFHGPVARPDLAAATGLSPATVGRAVQTLLGLGVIRDRPDLAHRGANGRPGVPLETDPAGPATLAVHIGRRTSVVAVCDLDCHVVSAVTVETPQGSPDDVVHELGAVAFRTLDAHRHRELVWGGVAAALRLNGDGTVDHDLLGWERVPLAELFSDVVGVPFSVAPHVEAMAAAELLVGHEVHRGTTLLVYGRESIGSALVIDGVVHQPAAGPADLTLIPFGPAGHLDDRGRGLEDTVADSGLLRAARRRGLRAETVGELDRLARTDPRAEELLADRAHALGRVVGTVSAVTRPDDVILAGQAFTGVPRLLGAVVDGVREACTTGWQPRLRVTTAGDAVQLRGALAVALDRVTADPESVLGPRPDTTGEDASSTVPIDANRSLDARRAQRSDSAA